jgi:hypothetical protein
MIVLRLAMAAGSDRRLGQIGVGFGIAVELVETFAGLPHAHGQAVAAEVLLAPGRDEVVGLIDVVEPVEFAHARAGVSLRGAKFFFSGPMPTDRTFFALPAVGAGAGSG